MTDPLRMNPGSQLNWTLLGNTVLSPEEEPFTGTDKGPQSTARNRDESILVYVAADPLQSHVFIL